MRFISGVLVCGVLLLVGTGSGCKKRTPGPIANEQQAKAEEPKKKEPEPAKKEEKKEPPAPKEGPKEGKSLAWNIHMQATRPTVQNELHQIGLIYLSDMPTTVDALKRAMKSAQIEKKIDEGIYVVNLKGRKLRPDEVLAYEGESFSPAGFAIVTGDGQFRDGVPLAELNKMLGIAK